MKNFFTLLLLLCASVSLAQSPTVLYGLTQSPGNGFYLASLDPATGLVSEISTVPIATTVVACYATLDPVNDIFYFFAPDSLVGVNTNTGVVTSRVPAILPQGFYFEMPLYNCRDSSIYGIYRDAVSATSVMLLAKMNPLTGVITVISPSTLDSGFVASTKGSIDPDAGIYHFEGISGFKGVSLQTGQIVYNTAPTFTGPGQYFTLSAWDCDDSIMFGMTQTPGALYPATMNMQTGVVTNLTAQGVPTSGYYMCTAEINSSPGLFHYSDVNGFMTINITTGNVIGNVPLTFSPQYGSLYFDWIARDNCKCFLSPIGIEETASQLVVSISPNPAQAGGPIQLIFPVQDEPVELRIFDLTGKLVFTEALAAGATNHVISETTLTPGMYVVTVGNMLPTRLVLTQ
ncbi:MAG: T9SS type A sorting domain-containing protein [Bacteroidia bacterium]|jgi:hypothetical protein|nr:T9SS type A sorting domain-containing protein [Bacteroidia bacterium]